MSENRRIRTGVFVGIEDRSKHFRKIGYSAVYFAVTFILLNYTSHAWSTANAWDLGFRPTFSYNGMEVLAGLDGWNLNRIAWVYLAPPLWALLISILSLASFASINGKHVHTRTLLFWLAVNGYLLYFSYVITGLLSGQDYGSKLFTGFVAFYSWLLWSPGKIYGVLIVQALVSLAVPLLFSKGVLQLNYSRLSASRKRGKAIVFLNVFAFPALAGCLLIALTTFPMDFHYQFIRMICLVLLGVVVGSGMAMYKAKHIHIVKGGLKPVPKYGLITLVIILLLARIGLGIEVHPLW